MHLLQRNLGRYTFKIGGATYEIYNRVYTTEQNQTYLSLKITKHMKKLQRLMWDCMMYVLVVKKNRKDGSYIIVSGQNI